MLKWQDYITQYRQLHIWVCHTYVKIEQQQHKPFKSINYIDTITELPYVKFIEHNIMKLCNIWNHLFMLPSRKAALLHEHSNCQAPCYLKHVPHSLTKTFPMLPYLAAENSLHQTMPCSISPCHSLCPPSAKHCHFTIGAVTQSGLFTLCGFISRSWLYFFLHCTALFWVSLDWYEAVS